MLSREVLAALLVLTQPGPPPSTSLGPLEPARGCYLGAYIELDPQVRDDVEAFEALVGKKHVSYLHYVGYGAPFPFAWVKALKARGCVPHIAWEPNDGLDKVRADDYLRGWAEAARQADCPIFLRFASEMNGNWQAWSGDAKLYIDKWRLVYRMIHEVAPKVVMIWCPFALPRATIDEYYPGDEYVDWVGVNIYSVICHDGHPDRPGREDPRDLLRPVYQRYADRKPLAICEYAATHYCAATRQATTDFALQAMRRLYESLPTEFPRVRMISWFSLDAARSGLAHNDYALTSDAQVLATYRELIRSDYFLSAVEQPAPMAVAAGQPAAPAPTAAPAAPSRPPAPWAAASPAPGAVDALHIALLGTSPQAAQGRATIFVQLPNRWAGLMVTVYLDDRIKGIGNAPPLSFPVDLTALKPGLHLIKIEVTDAAEQVVATAQAAFAVAGEK
jgi:hypothetical protein